MELIPEYAFPETIGLIFVGMINTISFSTIYIDSMQYSAHLRKKIYSYFLSRINFKSCCLELG